MTFGVTMKLSTKSIGLPTPTLLWIAALASVKVAPLFLPENVLVLVLPPFFAALVGTRLIALFRPALDPMLRRAIALLAGETFWLAADAFRTAAIPPAMVADILAGFSLAVLLVWRPSRVLVRVLIGGAGFSAALGIYLSLTAPGWSLDTATEALHAVLRLTILLFAVAALRTVNREREDAHFEEEVFS